MRCFLGEVFPQLLSNSHATTITKQKIFFFFQTDSDERQDKKCPAIFQICKIKKKLHQTLFRVAVHEEGVNSLAKWFKNEPPV